MPLRSLVRSALLCAVEAGADEDPDDGGRVEGGFGTLPTSLLTAGDGAGSGWVERVTCGAG